MSTLSSLCFIFAVTYLLSRWIHRQQLGALEQVHCVLAPRALPLEAHLQRRSSANTRLARVFELSNTFVRADPDTHKAFVADAQSLLQRWDVTTFPGTARVMLDAYTHLLPPTIAFDSLVQLITFTLVTETMLGGRVPPEQWREVLVVTSGINHLWEGSKTHPQLRSQDASLRAEMAAHLLRWLPHLVQPFDFVIPAYETMWRVIAVLVGRTAGAPDALSLRTYFDEPRDDIFRVPSNGHPSADMLVKETLRLHSPVRRISRSASSSPSTRILCAYLPKCLRPASVCTADLDALHRDTSIWGASAHEFNAHRFDPAVLTRKQCAAWSPFGQGPLSCVAIHDAPRLAALTAGAVLERIDEGEWKLNRGPKLGARRGWDGWTVEVVSSRSANI